jgi:hypothetical protein
LATISSNGNCSCNSRQKRNGMLDLKIITATVNNGVLPGEHKCQCGLRRFGDCLTVIRYDMNVVFVHYIIHKAAFRLSNNDKQHEFG